MPSTSQDVLDKMKLLFPDEAYISDTDACKFLQSAGYKPTEDWCWLLPNPDHVPTEDEKLCLVYLIEEWDFGGLILSAGEV